MQAGLRLRLNGATLVKENREQTYRYDKRRQRCGYSRGARLSRDAVFDLRLEKAEGLFGHGKSNSAAWRSDASSGCCRSDFHGAPGGVRRCCWSVCASFGFTHGFIHAGNCAYWASLLDNTRCRPSRQHGWLLQRSQHHGRLLAVVHYWCGKIFGRCDVRDSCAMTCVLSPLRAGPVR